MRIKLLILCLILGIKSFVFCNMVYPNDPEKWKYYNLSSDYKQLSNADIASRISQDDTDPALTYELCYDLVWDKIDVDPDDLKYLKWVIKTNKRSYDVGEPIGLKVFLCNTSDKEIAIRNAFLPRFFILSSIQIQQCEAVENGKLIKPVRSDVFMTTEGYSILESKQLHEYRHNNMIYEKIVLKSGQMHEMEMAFPCLNIFYDLTSGSNYELIFYHRNFRGDNQINEYPKPCRIQFSMGGYAHIPIDWSETPPNTSVDFSVNSSR